MNAVLMAEEKLADRLCDDGSIEADEIDDPTDVTETYEVDGLSVIETLSKIEVEALVSLLTDSAGEDPDEAMLWSTEVGMTVEDETKALSVCKELVEVRSPDAGSDALVMSIERLDERASSDAEADILL